MPAVDAFTGLGSEIVRIAFGSPCVACGGELPVRRRVGSCCVDCWSRLPRIDDDRCARCALPLPAAEGRTGTECLGCLTEPLAASWIDSWGRYDSGLTKVLHAFKFYGHAFLSVPLADLLMDALHARGDRGRDAIVPVPMHPSRERKRGYNQAELLARGVARRSGMAMKSGLLAKIDERRVQADLRKDERRANVKGSFRASRDARGLAILLVDDVCTTGETLSACAAALLDAGAADVAAITVARTP
jgi:competence protein ComFC